MLDDAGDEEEQEDSLLNRVTSASWRGIDPIKPPQLALLSCFPDFDLEQSLLESLPRLLTPGVMNIAVCFDSRDATLACFLRVVCRNVDGKRRFARVCLLALVTSTKSDEENCGLVEMSQFETHDDCLNIFLILGEIFKARGFEFSENDISRF